MPVESAPLLHYYSFLNAAKALLVSRNIAFREHHGLRAHDIRGASRKIDLSNEGVKVQAQGVFPELAAYLGDSESSDVHSLKDLLFNLPFVHRTYCLTYRSQSDLFYPLRNCRYVFDGSSKQAYLAADLSGDFEGRYFLSKLPNTFVADQLGSSSGAIRSTASVAVSGSNIRSPTDLANIATLHRGVRKDLLYINGAQTLWYVKALVRGGKRLHRSTLTLTLAAMHRLSELCRYRPLQLASFLSGQRNWLLSEFVRMSPEQYLDEMASELTGHQFLIPNVRPAS